MFTHHTSQTIQSQQQAERDTAIARLEQSRILLATRLSEHQGGKHKVIEEAQAFVSNVRVASPFITPENLFVEPRSQTGDNAGAEKLTKPHALMQMLISSLAFAKSSLSLERFSGALGSAALFAVSMLALLQIQKAALKQEVPALSNRSFQRGKSERMGAKVDYSSQSDLLQYFDVYSARG